MLELSCLGNCDRRLIPIKRFVPVGCEKINSAPGQQMQSNCTLGDRVLFQFRQHRFTQSSSTMLLANDHRAQQEIGTSTLQPSISNQFPIHVESVELPSRIAHIIVGQSSLTQRRTELIQTARPYFNHMHHQCSY
ncbi:hypothetical protein AN403_4233 [Pseudomonas fluorescens]|uniref:Uncharacterized protein n=1 Tax=Pseudomonas fluorescens TaxID=294 RepID=A0A0P9BC09_PSEFL|nr:hypothetical protein AN403_4233 [Pseudomonas fluorescens]